jgi:hypothetical protein
MPRTRTAFASQAFTGRPWSLPRMCALCLAGGSVAAMSLALLFAFMG